MEKWFEISNSDKVLTPALLFYPERIRRNIDRMIQISGPPDQLRPHIKTYKCPEIVDMQLKAGIKKFKCATLSETEMLASQGVIDILLAYPLVGPSQSKFIELARKFPDTKFSALVDHPKQIETWEACNFPINVLIDIDVGMHRTGIAPSKAYDLFKQLRQKRNLTFAGLHVYDGHIHDQNVEKRKVTVDQTFNSVNQLISNIKTQGIKSFEVICGGSISFPIHAQYPERTLSPGTTLLWDHGYSTNFPDLPFIIAAVLLTRVVSKPKENLLCLDLGHKAVASEMKTAPVHFPDLPDAKILVHSEEHLVIETSEAANTKIGDTLYGFPWHICPTVALHEQAGVVEDGIVKHFWNIEARKRAYQL